MLTRNVIFGLLAWLVANLFFIAGCSVNAMPREFVVVGQALATTMSEQALWEQLTAALRGHVNNPGFRVQAGVMYVAEGRLIGVDGDVELRGQGVGTGVPASPETMDLVRELLRRDPGNLEAIERLIEAVKAERPAPVLVETVQ